MGTLRWKRPTLTVAPSAVLHVQVNRNGVSPGKRVSESSTGTVMSQIVMALYRLGRAGRDSQCQVGRRVVR